MCCTAAPRRFHNKKQFRGGPGRVRLYGMGAGASSAALVRRDVRCSSRTFDGLQDMSGGPCSCRACVRERQRSSPPLMDAHDAYTLTTAMRVIERSHTQVMPPRPRRASARFPPSAPEQDEDEATGGTAATNTTATNAATVILRRRAGIDTPTTRRGTDLDATPAGKENADPRLPSTSRSPVFEESPLKPAMEAYSAAVLRSAVSNQPPTKSPPACGRRAPSLQICKPDFTASSVDV